MARKTKDEALETRKKLLESALDVMSEKSFSSVSMNEIAVRIGLSKGAVYWHFKNKNNLLISLLDDLCTQAKKDLYDSDRVPEEFKDLRIFFRKKILAATGSGQAEKVSKLLHRRYEWPEDVLDLAVAAFRDMTGYERNMVTDVIAKAQQAHEMRDDLPANELAILVLAVFHGLFFLQMHEFYLFDFVKYTDFIFDAIESELKIKIEPKSENTAIIMTLLDNSRKCDAKEMV
jgi:TetR/AcrR family acrAB operon transcriptional repressor